MTEASVRARILAHPLASLLASVSEEAQVHAVGGVVRDALLSAVTDDLDLTVAEGGAPLARRLAEASGGTLIELGGDRFASYRVVSGAVQADVWDRRGGSLQADLARRDLTINAIACAIDSGRIEDPFGGLSDLATRTLRATKLDCFERDALRVLRLVRFGMTLEGFTIEAATAAAALDAAPGLEDVATERIREELHRILAAESTRAALETLHDVGALEVLMPEAQSPAAWKALLDRGARLDECLAALPGAAVADARRLGALALLTSLPETEGADLGTRGLATPKLLRGAQGLLTNQLPIDDDSRRLFLLEQGTNWPLSLAVNMAVRTPMDARAVADAAKTLEEIARLHPSLIEGPPQLVDGHAAARLMGVEPGPIVGEALRALRRAQALGQVEAREDAENYVREWRAANPAWEDEL